MDFEIIPLEGVGDIKFGMSPTEVRTEFGRDFASFKRTLQASYPCDYYERAGVFFYYDFNGKLEAIEFTSPAEPIIKGLKFVGLAFGDALAMLEALSSELKREVDGVIAYNLGISIYAPLAKADSSAPVESVLAFKRGYYN